MYELKKIGKVFTSIFVGIGPSSYKKRVYRAAVSQRSTNTALHVSGGFSAHHQQLKNCKHSIAYTSSLLAATASGSRKQAQHIPDAV